jgi:hypothetical protein
VAGPQGASYEAIFSGLFGLGMCRGVEDGHTSDSLKRSSRICLTVEMGLVS